MNFMREDIHNTPLALSLGWTIDDSTKDQNGRTFIRGDTRIWAIREGWQVADVLEGYYRNHRKQPSLEEALMKEGPAQSIAPKGDSSHG